jgi:hypothetical protein
MAREFVKRPDCEQAHSFQCSTCEDPNCGLHLIPTRQNGQPICEVVIGREQLRGVLRCIHENGLDL